MENINGWQKLEKRFNKNNQTLISTASEISIRGVLNMLQDNLNPNDPRQVLPLGHGDPSHFPCFATPPSAEKAVVDALCSRQFNSYSSTVGILPARKAVAEYLSIHLPHKLSPDDIFLTVGCTHAIEVLISALAQSGVNILLPKPSYPHYEARSSYVGLEYRHFSLLPEKGWEVDLDEVESLADKNTVAIVIINPGNPCGNVYTYEHLQKVAETAKKLGIFVIADEVYEHLTFGNNPFVPMGVFASIVPVVTLGSISKRWIVPGWRIGWLVTNDMQGILQKSGLVDSIKEVLNLCSNPTTFIQGALPQIFKNTKDCFFSKTINTLRQDADFCYQKLKEIPCITCTSKPEGSMFVMVKLNLSLLSDIKDDLDFCLKLAKEENVVVLPGFAVGVKNWLRITFALEPSALEEGLERIKMFCLRHSN